jgi:multicomponent Na+:H+ antiporter subunit G
MQDWFTGGLLLAGGIFAFIAALGIVRLPDAIIRMHAATKAGTLGCGLIFAAVAVNRLETGTTLRAGAAIVFLLLTAPVAAHLIGRAGYKSGIRLWEKTWVDHLGDRYGDRPVESKSAPGRSDDHP